MFMYIFAAMRKNGLITAIFASFLLLWNACSTDLDVDGEWKDITVVYGVLDQSQKTQYIKLNKAFLGEGNALQMAQIPDSSYYNPENMSVKIEELNLQGVNLIPTGRVFKFDTTLVTDKEEGTFYYPNQIVYASTIDTLYSEYYYKLHIVNAATNKEISSITPLVGDPTIKKPLYNPYNPLINFKYTEATSSVLLISGNNGRLYDVTYRFHYYDVIPGGDTTAKYIDWNLGSRTVTSIEGGEDIEYIYRGMDFYLFVENTIPDNPNVHRIANKIDLIIGAASDEFSTYVDLNQPSGSLIQDRPQYTNIENGLGLFSSRYIISRNYGLHPEIYTNLKTHTTRGFINPQ